MKLGIDREKIGREIDAELTTSQLVTMSKAEARTLIKILGNEFDDIETEELSTALDYAQGEEHPSGRYVVIYVAF